MKVRRAIIKVFYDTARGLNERELEALHITIDVYGMTVHMGVVKG